MRKRREKKETRTHPLYTSILLFLMALAAVTAATIAWFSIADSTKVKSMNLDITSGASLRFDLDAHNTFEEYAKTLGFTQIASRIQQEQGFDMELTPLEPVTTGNYTEFSFEDGTLVETTSGAYLTFNLNFMSTRDMVVHLSSASSTSDQGATAVSSNNAALAQAMRISFTIGNETVIYSPSMGDESIISDNAKMFGLLDSNMIYNDNNALFTLKEAENKEVLVHIWLEGTDAACTDDLKGADYSIALLFEGTDENNQLFSEEK